MRGPPPEKVEEEKPPDEYSVPVKPSALPASTGPPDEQAAGLGGMLAILGGETEEEP